MQKSNKQQYESKSQPKYGKNKWTQPTHKMEDDFLANRVDK